MPGPIIARKLIQMGLDFTGKQIAKKSAKSSTRKIIKDLGTEKVPGPKADARSKAFYDSIYKNL
jgi:hypothetical protein